MDLTGDKLNAAIQLCRHLPTVEIANAIEGAGQLSGDEELEQKLLSILDQPLEIMTDPTLGREFIQSEHNRDGNYYRSPWSNKYFPEGAPANLYTPAANIRGIEERMNLRLAEYGKLYFDNAFTSAYFWADEQSFSAALLTKRDILQEAESAEGGWNGIHLVNVVTSGGNNITYTMNSSVLISLNIKSKLYGALQMSGTLKHKSTNSIKKDKPDASFHVKQIGGLLEANELKIRNDLEEVYIGKTKQMVNTGRLRYEYMSKAEKINFLDEMKGTVKKK